MELLQFEVTNAGTLGGRWTPPAPETKKASSLPRAALAALLQEEDDEDDWGGDAPDMSAEFARLGHLNEEPDTDALPLTADFAPLPDGSLALVRWPRLDFSARMALARLEASAGLSPADRQWYCSVLVQYFDHAAQFMPCPAEQAYAALFRFLCRTDLLTASDVSTLLRMAGALCLPAELISEMIEVRTRRFETVTGFEDLELD